MEHKKNAGQPNQNRLNKFNIDIAARSEVRFTESGRIRKEMSYSLYESRITSTNRSESGMAMWSGMAIFCYPSAQNTSWSYPAPSNTSKSTRIPGCTQDPNTITSSTVSSCDNVIWQTFWTSAMRRPNCSTDHVIIKFSTKLAENEERQNINQEACSQVRDDLQALLNYRQAEIPAEEKWNALIMYNVYREKLCTAVRKHENWFNRNSIKLKELIKNRNLAWNNMLSKNTKSAKARYKTSCQLLW